MSSFPKVEPHEIPSKACRIYIIEFVAKFYEANTLRSLESKYVRYHEEGPTKFKLEMRELMMEVLQAPMWRTETEKRGFSRWMDDRVHDALWNPKNVLAKYGKLYRGGDVEFNDVVCKADCFHAQMRPFSKNQNRRGSIGW